MWLSSHDLASIVSRPRLPRMREAVLLPVHDRPAKVEGSQIVGRLQDAVPGPLTQSLSPRNWFPA
jgi:hypothetical protein